MDTEVIYPPGTLLLQQSRPSSGAVWRFNDGRGTLGRDPSADVCVDDVSVSRRHATLIRRGSTWSIADAGSTNGTYVNGARVGERNLKHGDRIQVGNAELVVILHGPHSTDGKGGAPRFDVQSQAGNISNIAGNQSNYYQRESSLRYIASRRGRARALIVWGIVLFFIGSGFPLFFVSELFKDFFSGKRGQARG